jgi:hypothetical protein
MGTATGDMTYNPARPNARVAKLVDARDLSNLSTRLGNGRREWGQIRGTSPTARGAPPTAVPAIPS